LELHLDISVYCDVKFNPEQMFRMFYGLYSGLDMRPYADPAFGDAQLGEIMIGLSSGLDVRPYAHPQLSADEMKTIRDLLTKNGGFWLDHYNINSGDSVATMSKFD
jgi:hypothetical protein